MEQREVARHHFDLRRHAAQRGGDPRRARRVTLEIKKRTSKKTSPFRDEGYVGYERKDDGKYKDDKGKPHHRRAAFREASRRRSR